MFKHNFYTSESWMQQGSRKEVCSSNKSIVSLARDPSSCEKTRTRERESERPDFWAHFQTCRCQLFLLLFCSFSLNSCITRRIIIYAKWAAAAVNRASLVFSRFSTSYSSASTRNARRLLILIHVRTQSSKKPMTRAQIIIVAQLWLI